MSPEYMQNENGSAGVVVSSGSVYVGQRAEVGVPLETEAFPSGPTALEITCQRAISKIRKVHLYNHRHIVVGWLMFVQLPEMVLRL